MYQDEEKIGQSIDLDVIQCIGTDRLITYDGFGLSGTGMRFRHSVSHFEEQQFQEWNCGFVNGTLIVRGR